MGIPEIWVVDPDDGVWTRFEEGQLLRRPEFSLTERKISFQISEIAKLLR